MPVVEVNGAKLNVMQLQQKSDLPQKDLVLCHGLASSMGFWVQGYIYALSPYFRITLYDQRGHGRSSSPESGYSAAALGADLEALCRELGIERPHVMAHSFGGVAALEWAARDPEALASLTILDSHISIGRAEACRTDKARKVSFDAALVAAGIEIDFEDPYYGIKMITALAKKRLDGTVDEECDPRVAYLMASMPRSSATKWMKLVERTNVLTELSAPDGLSAEALARLTTPTFGIYGSKSSAMRTGEILADLVPNFDLSVFEDAGHFFANTRVPEVLARCASYWDLPELSDDVVEDAKVA